MSTISEFLKARMDSFSLKPLVYNYGTVTKVSDGVVWVEGLEGRVFGELIEFEGGVYGMVMELMENGVGFITSSPVRRVLRGTDGRPAGVEIVNRSGRRTIRADEVVDATLYGTLGKVPAVSAEETFSRIVISHRAAPSAPGMKVETFPERLTAPHSTFDGRAYRCTFSVPMKDGSFPSFAAAEWASRELTRTPALADAADFLVWHPSPAALAGAKPMSDELPLWGEYDVVVVGGGTSGVPAALAAARAGAKVLLVEYLSVLGGVGTDGMILGYYDGNPCGFTEEFKRANKEIGGRFGLYRRAETWRQMCRQAGVTVWLGAMGTDAIVENGKVTGVEIATALGCGTVKAKCVIDGTGNSDIAALAGAETTFLSEKEFALQSAGQAPQRLGYGGINSDFGFVDDSSAWDLWLFGLRARAGAPNAWDIASLPDSRERRRIVPDYMLNAQDVTSHRPFPDTVVQPHSRQDSHGYLTDDFRFISESSEEPSLYEKGAPRYAFNCNLPLRSLLPKGLTAVAVIGLGAGVARDVVPIVRMQADLMNMGYGVGTAAAMAAKKGGDFRTIDFGELRKRLVDKKILRPEALAWAADVDTGSDGLLAESVRTMAEGYRGSHVVWRPENRVRARPLLQAAYRAAKTAEARQVYAKTLGLMGDATGADTLLAVVRHDEKIAKLSGVRGGAFGGGNQGIDGFLVALGRTRDPRALEPLVERLKAVPEKSPVVALRGPTLALEALGDPKAAPALAEMMKREGWHGFAVRDFRTLQPIGGYGLGPEMDNCIRELALARTLWACGDPDGLAKRTLEAYAADPRGVLSAHASAVLKSRR